MDRGPSFDSLFPGRYHFAARHRCTNVSVVARGYDVLYDMWWHVAYLLFCEDEAAMLVKIGKVVMHIVYTFPRVYAALLPGMS